MPGCSAVGCSNSAKKGFLMKKFPKNPERRKEWTIKTKRGGNWKPSDNSCLCEIHFAPDMWEKTRVDGTRKLKANAVPTIFSFTKEVVTRRSPRNRISSITETSKNIPVLEDNNMLSAPSTSSAGNTLEINKQATTAETLTVNFEAQVLPSTSLTVEPDQQLNKTKSLNEEVSLSSSDNSGLNCFPETSKKDLKLKLLRYEKMYQRQKAKTLHYKRLYRNVTKQAKQEKDNVILNKIFTSDQIRLLCRRSKERSSIFVKWSKQTIAKALKLKFSCGGNGYEELLKQGQPLPSVRTLQRSLHRLKFDCGILYEIFDFLKIKVDKFERIEKDCVLVLDEMSITPGNNYDTALHKYFGDVTLPQHEGLATHVLVFMLGGVTLRWKQVVAYYYTSDSTNGSVIKDIITDICKLTRDIGLNIICITSDMGSPNQGLWRTIGIKAGRNEETVCKTSCFDEKKQIYFMADVPHLFKNIKQMLITNKIIRFPKEFQIKHVLPTNEVVSQHILDLIEHQENHCFKLAPRLTEDDLLPTHFSKMKVSTSTNVINHSVVSALKYLAEDLQRPEYLSTAWFLEQVEHWFFIMTSRHPSVAISKHNEKSYQEATQFLHDFIKLFAGLEVGLKKIWKPSQTGVLISTQSILEIQELLLNNQGYQFILTGRFSQDCLENLFSVLRSKQVVPNALQLKNNLKLVCISQYMKHAVHGSYEEDDREFLGDFLETISTTPTTTSAHPIPETEEITPKTNTLNLNRSELNSLYNICGYIISSIKKTSRYCEKCLGAVGSKTPIHKSFTKFTLLKCFRQNTLFFCNEKTFCFFLDMENIFQIYLSVTENKNINIKQFYLNKLNDIEFSIPDCHNLKSKIMNRFLIFRLKIHSKKVLKRNKRNYSSKSVAAQNL